MDEVSSFLHAYKQCLHSIFTVIIMDKGTLKCLIFGEKMKFIKIVEENKKTKEKTPSQIAKNFGIPTSTLSTIISKTTKFSNNFRTITLEKEMYIF